VRVSLIAALDDSGLIGRDGVMPWHLPDDLRRFRRLTLGKPVVMGRRTFRSIGHPLSGRRNIVVSRTLSETSGIEVVAVLDRALEICAGAEEVMIIGGAALYREALPRAERLYLTRIAARFEGDTYFPAVDWSEWRAVRCEPPGGAPA